MCRANYHHFNFQIINHSSMGNCTQAPPEDANLSKDTDNPLISPSSSVKTVSKSTSKSNVNRNRKKHSCNSNQDVFCLIVGFDNNYLKLYRCKNIKRLNHYDCNAKFVADITQVTKNHLNNPNSTIIEFEDEIRKTIINKYSSIFGKDKDNRKGSKGSKFTLIDSKTKSDLSSLYSLKCNDFQIIHDTSINKKVKFSRCLIVEKAIELNIELLNSNNNFNLSNKDSKYIVYEHETLENVLCKYCIFFNTVPSYIELYKKTNNNKNNVNGIKVMESIDNFETVKDNNLTNNDTLVIGRRKHKTKLSGIDCNINDYNYHMHSDSMAMGMRLYVKTLSSEKKVELNNVEKDYIGLDCKYLISKNTNNRYQINQQRLVFAGRQIDDQESLETVGIANESVLHLVLKFG